MAIKVLPPDDGSREGDDRTPQAVARYKKMPGGVRVREAVGYRRGSIAGVGLTYVDGRVRSTAVGRRARRVRFLVDSGAVYSLVPGATLRKLGLRPYREVIFSLADGTTVTRKVGDAYFEINGDLGPAPVIFGEEGDEPLLGATTLESLGLVLDPFKRRLIPMRMVLG